MIIQSDQTNSQMCAIHLQKFTLEAVTELISQRDTIQSRRDWNPNQLNDPFCSCFRFLSLVVYNVTRHKQTCSGFRFCRGVILNFNHQNVVILCGENKDKEELRRSLKLNRTNSSQWTTHSVQGVYPKLAFKHVLHWSQEEFRGLPKLSIDASFCEVALLGFK